MNTPELTRTPCLPTACRTLAVARGALLEEAAEWHVRLQDEEFDPAEPYPDIVRRNEAFLAWLRQSTHHLEAFLQVYSTARRLACIGQKIDIEAVLIHRDAEIIKAETRANRLGPTWRRPAPRILCLLAASVGVAIAVACFSSLAVNRVSEYVYATHVGEVKKFTLADGTRVVLDTDSKVVADFTHRSREVNVIRGSAVFTVAHDDTRPFKTCASGVLLTDRGTEFAVEASARGAGVTVASGAVEVSGRCASSNAVARLSPTAPVTLAAGEHADITIRETGLEIRTQRRTQHQLDTALAWQGGVLVFKDTSLGQVLAEVNRYLPRKLVLADPTLGSVSFEGIIHLPILETSFLAGVRDVCGVIPDPSGSTAAEVRLVRGPPRGEGGAPP